MTATKKLVYDGTFNGFLTAVFIGFEQKLFNASILKKGHIQNGLFTETETIFTNIDKAQRVWNGIKNKNSTAIKNIYFAYQSEQEQAEILLYHYIQKLMDVSENIAQGISDDCMQKVNQLALKVGKEKIKIETFLPFQTTKDTVKFAPIEPAFDVLPLLSKHFRNRYANEKWIIYDVKRNYGLFYDLKRIEVISLDVQDMNAISNTVIQSRIKPKLHKQNNYNHNWKHKIEKKEAV